tara:strand:+ start:96 stop:866 length:771 start_codon:yes stop_codon:yes gene_type:complete
MNDLKQYTILITGAASGNGYGIAKFCTDYFSRLILVDKDKVGLEKAKDEFYKNNKDLTIETLTCDFSESSEINSLINDLNKKKITIHCLVNNAGITIPSNLNFSLKKQLKIWDDTLKVNLTAPFHLSVGLKDLIPNDIGSIINITSLNSTLSFPDNPAYMASKGGLRQLSLSLANDLSDRKIRVNSIAPGYFKTNMTKESWNDLEKRELRASKTFLKRWGYPSELGGLVCFLASNISSYITGQEIYIDGGWSKKGL